MAIALSRNLALLKSSRKVSLATVAANIKKAGLRLDYLTAVDAETLETRKKPATGCCVLVAAYCGKTRLIDNILL